MIRESAGARAGMNSWLLLHDPRTWLTFDSNEVMCRFSRAADSYHSQRAFAMSPALHRDTARLLRKVHWELSSLPSVRFISPRLLFYVLSVLQLGYYVAIVISFTIQICYPNGFQNNNSHKFLEVCVHIDYIEEENEVFVL